MNCKGYGKKKSCPNLLGRHSHELDKITKRLSQCVILAEIWTRNLPNTKTISRSVQASCSLKRCQCSCAFAKFRKASISLVKFVRLSVHPKGTGSHWAHFHEIWNYSIFSKIRRENLIFIKIWQELGGTLHDDLCTFTMTFCLILVRMRNVSEASCTPNQNTFYVQ